MSKAEIIELMWLDICGFNYIVRNENGSVEVFKNKPHREHSCGYDTWVENKYPLTNDEIKRRKYTELGDYNFVHFNMKKKSLGYFKNKENAIKARKKAEEELFGKYARRT